jgi:hypothetical protein
VFGAVNSHDSTGEQGGCGAQQDCWRALVGWAKGEHSLSDRHAQNFGYRIYRMRKIAGTGQFFLGQKMAAHCK